MQENPPHSTTEIRILLSQYLDGEMDPAQMMEIDALLEKFPAYRQELMKLQATQAALKNTLPPEAGASKTPDSSNLWRQIEKQLQADQHAFPTDCDPEFISAYYDGEIPSADPAFLAFEAQLPQNAEANRLLADVAQISEAVRRFGYRLEEACTLDISRQVMQAFQVEQGLSPAEKMQDAQDSVTETISAFVDQELSAREVIEANRLVEGDESARRLVARFNWLSAQIQSISEQFQAQAPDVWPQVQAQLQASSPPENVVPLAGRQRKQLIRGLKVAVPVAAAAVFIFLTLPAVPLSEAPVESSADGILLGSRPVGEQLASVPMAVMSDAVLPVSAPQAEVPVVMNIDARQDIMPEPASPRLEPAVQPRERVAAQPRTMPTAPRRKTMGGAHPQRTPSSEEYLFQALSEQMPDEDIAAILGK